MLRPYQKSSYHSHVVAPFLLSEGSKCCAPLKGAGVQEWCTFLLSERPKFSAPIKRAAVTGRAVAPFGQSERSKFYVPIKEAGKNHRSSYSNYEPGEKDMQMGGLSLAMARMAAGTDQRPSPAIKPAAATGTNESASVGLRRSHTSFTTDPMHMSTCTHDRGLQNVTAIYLQLPPPFPPTRTYFIHDRRAALSTKSLCLILPQRRQCQALLASLSLSIACESSEIASLGGDLERREKRVNNNRQKSVTHCQVGADVEGDGCGHGYGHKTRITFRQHVTESADGDRSSKEARAQRHAVLRQRRHALHSQRLT